jgi:predicted phosphodiesterase
MKFILMGDLHYTDRQPPLRRDNFFETLRGKVEFIIKLAKKEDAYILQPGDWFDSHKASYSCMSKLLRMLKSHSPLPGIITVFGQHDLRFHKSDTENTPLNLMNEAYPHIFIAPNPGAMMVPDSNVRIKGCSWNEEPVDPEIQEMRNILLIHRMIYEEQSYPGQEVEGESANIFLRKHAGFDLIVSGDNHKSFTAKVGRRLLVNCGALMRTSIDMQNHQPCCYLYDSLQHTLKKIIIPCSPFSEIFNFEQHELSKKVDNEKLEAFVRSLSTGGAPISINFVKIMMDRINKARAELEEGIISILEEIMQ